MMAGLAVTALLAAGCRSPEPASGGAQALPNFGPPMQDVRTEAAVQQIELDYIAAKNSTRTNQHLADAEKKKRDEAQAKAAAEKAAQAKQDAGATKSTPPAEQAPPKN